jgi:serine protease Do
MDEFVLIDTVERFLRGEMSPQETAAFAELRKNNPEIDQMVVENTYFLQGLHKYGELKNIKHSISEVETQLAAEGIITQPQLRGSARVIYLWNKYKKNIAVAASIAAVISLTSTGLVFNYAKKYGSESYQELVSKINQTNQEVNKLKNNQLSSPAAKQEPKVDYRATGFLIDGKGYLVTNAHVISKMKNIYVENNKGEYFTASEVFRDNVSDLAIVKIVDTSFNVITSLPYSVNKVNADLGEQFFTLGFPRNEIVYGEGYVSAKSGNDGDSTSYQLTVSANPGNSGGPVINKNGEIIGIITGKDTKADGVVYAAKSKNIFRMIDSLKKDDTKFNNLKIPANNGLKGLDRVKQVKKMEDFVFKVIGN